MSKYDEYRPPQQPRRRGGGGKKKKRRGAGAMDGSKEARMSEDLTFDSYYGRQVVKAPPWEWPIGAYLFLGGVAGGSALLATGAMATRNPVLLTRARLTSFVAAGAGSVCLVLDLGRPERLFNMFRVFKVTSPMSMGSWLLGAFGGTSAVGAAAELPVPFASLIRKVAVPTTILTGVLGGPLAGYTAVLFADTANPTWNGAKKHLPYVFVSSASLAAAGIAMALTPTTHAGPARALALTGATGDLYFTHAMKEGMEPEERAPLERGTPGKLMQASEYLVAAGGIGTAVASLTKSRAVAAVSGIALAAGSLCTRFGVLNAGKEAVKDPSTTIGPQKRRAERKRLRDMVVSVR